VNSGSQRAPQKEEGPLEKNKKEPRRVWSVASKLVLQCSSADLWRCRQNPFQCER